MDHSSLEDEGRCKLMIVNCLFNVVLNVDLCSPVNKSQGYLTIGLLRAN